MGIFIKIYYIEQEMIGLKGNYYICDSNNNKCLEVNTNGLALILNRFLSGIFSIGYNLYLNDSNGIEVYNIRKKSGFIKEEFIIKKNNILAWNIKQDIKSFNPKFYIFKETEKYIIKGDIEGRNFVIYKEEKCVARISKFRCGIKDKYKLDIFEEDNDYLFISVGIVLAILFR